MGAAGFGDRNAAGVIGCLASRKDGCGGLLDCIGATLSLDGPCETRCDGDTLVACADSDRPRTRTDCRAFGLKCFERDAGETSAGCFESDAPSCTSGSFVPGCTSDGRPRSCGGEVQRETRGPHCADFNLACGASGCAGTEGACTIRDAPGGLASIEYSGVGCDGAKLKACVSGGLTTVDCTAHVLGTTCQTLNGDLGPISYCGVAAECDPQHPAQSGCDGDSVVVCNGGKIARVDCKDLGFSGCLGVGDHAICVHSVSGDALALPAGFTRLRCAWVEVEAGTSLLSARATKASTPLLPSGPRSRQETSSRAAVPVHYLFGQSNADLAPLT